jgi:hypothetical protein
MHPFVVYSASLAFFNATSSPQHHHPLTDSASMPGGTATSSAVLFSSHQILTPFSPDY